MPVTYYGEEFRDYCPPASIVQYNVDLPETGRYRSQADFNAPVPSHDLVSQRLSLGPTIAGGAMQGA